MEMENKIPKVIHYIWVGGNEKPKDIKKCMKSWEKHLEGYKIKEWNESNFDINSHPFCKAAYEAKKWAFVSDYIRAYVLYNEGGIYLDTDVILLDNFDEFLNNRAFFGFENEKFISAAIFGAEPKHPITKSMLDYYDNLDLYKFDFKSNNSLSTTKILEENYNLNLNNKTQMCDEGIKIYKDTILSNPSKESISVHIFTGTWLDDKKSLKYKIVKFFKLGITKKWQAELYRKIFN